MGRRGIVGGKNARSLEGMYGAGMETFAYSVKLDKKTIK